MEQRMLVMPSRKLLYKKGVTLVEVIVALVVLLIVFMGLLQAALLTIDVNLRNAYRDEAARIAADDIALARSSSFDTALAVGTTGPTQVDRIFRGGVTESFFRTRTVASASTNNKTVAVTVTWSYKSENFSHTVNAMVSR